jgi:putative ABC transport system permease protein
MSTLSLALRNLLRNRRRSVITLLAMIIGVVCILLFGGFSRNISLGLQTNFVRGGGHLQVQHRDYFLYGTGDPLDYGIASYQHVIEVIQKDPVLAPMLTVVTPTLQVGGIAGNYAAGVSRTVFASGNVAEDQARLQQWNDYGFGGRPAPPALLGTAPDAAVVGRGLARVLQICTPLHVTGCTDGVHGQIRKPRPCRLTLSPCSRSMRRARLDRRPRPAQPVRRGSSCWRQPPTAPRMWPSCPS